MDIREANIRQPQLWKADSWDSVQYYNDWFMSFAPEAFKTARKGVMQLVYTAFSNTDDLMAITENSILQTPEIIGALRMMTAPPLAQDRLCGLSNVKKSVLTSLEKGKIPRNCEESNISINSLLNIVKRMLDKEIFPWLSGSTKTPQQRKRSAAIIADRMTGALSDPIIRNAQEKRQLDTLSTYLNSKGYSYQSDASDFTKMKAMSYSFHVNVPVKVAGNSEVKMPIDVLVKTSNENEFPVLIECKSAGDFTNTNKRRKEEALKASQLRASYGDDIIFCLYLCGYFDTGYLGYEAAEGIDWVWEHRTQDFDKLGI